MSGSETSGLFSRFSRSALAMEAVEVSPSSLGRANVSPTRGENSIDKVGGQTGRHFDFYFHFGLLRRARLVCGQFNEYLRSAGRNLLAP